MEKIKIKLLNNISMEGLKLLPENLYEVSKEMENPDAIIVRSHNMHEFEFPSATQVVGRAGAGVNNIPIPKLTEKGVLVMNTPGANANAVKELVLTGLFLVSRNIWPALNFVKNLDPADPNLSELIEKSKKKFSGSELSGKTIGVIGLGSVGVKVANAAIALGMNVFGYDPVLSVSRAIELNPKVRLAESLDALLSISSYITVHVPLIAETKNMINETSFGFMRPGVVLLNFARDGIIELEALINGMNSGKVGCYVTDFPHPAINNHPQALCLPHLGASTLEAEENCAKMIVMQIRKYFESGEVENAVNFPSLSLAPQLNNYRITVTAVPDPDLFLRIAKILNNNGFSIVNERSRVQKDISYTIIDIDKELEEYMLEDILEMDGIMKIRQLHCV